MRPATRRLHFGRLEIIRLPALRLPLHDKVRHVSGLNILLSLLLSEQRLTRMKESAILNSWKEISNYIGRGVRTVQRWEKDFGLPVRRPCGHLRGSVFATKSDVDEWLKTRAARTAISAEVVSTKVNPYFTHVQLAGFDTFQKRADRLQQQCESMRRGFATLASTLARTQSLRQEMRALSAGGSSAPESAAS